MILFDRFTWKSEPPEHIPFEQSKLFSTITFTGKSSDYRVADTFYPSWASDDKMYSPYTDGAVEGVWSISDYNGRHGAPGTENYETSSTGNVVIEGNDPTALKLTPLKVNFADPKPYGGRYPCGTLVYNGVWYYGTYCLSPFGQTRYGKTIYNWPHLGPFVGFRISHDYGINWDECPHTPDKPIFDEFGLYGHPVKIGSPHFVDFGKNMEHSPDGKAYLVAHGSDMKFMPNSNFAHNSWITGDQVYLIRVLPTPETINDPKAYEFFSGNNLDGTPRWSNSFEEIQPLLEWQNNMGCVTVTFNPPLKRYFMAVTDGKNTCSKMNTYILESDSITGPWHLVTYMKDFGEQAYFVNFPSKFIKEDGKTMWICYSGNFATDWNGEKIKTNPPGSQYGLVLQEIKLS